MHAASEIQDIIKDIIAQELAVNKDELKAEVSFHDLGLDSVNSIFLIALLEEKLGIDIDPMSVYDNPSIRSFSEYIVAEVNGTR